MNPQFYQSELERLEAAGRDHRRGNIFLYGAEYIDIAASNKDMEFANLTDKIRDRILAVYGVPPHKVGIKAPGSLGGKGDAEQNDINFWEKRRGW